MADLFFSERLLEKLILHAELRKHLLQPAVFIIHRLHLGNHRGIHAAILRAPLIKGRAAHAVFPAKLRNRHATIGLL